MNKEYLIFVVGYDFSDIFEKYEMTNDEAYEVAKLLVDRYYEEDWDDLNLSLYQSFFNFAEVYIHKCIDEVKDS